MSTWTSRLAGLAACSMLVACTGGLNGTRSAPEAIRLPDGLVVAGARGWCVDQRSMRRSGDATVVVLGSCAALSRNALLPRPPVQGVVTIWVEDEPGTPPPFDLLADYLNTSDGRAALARDGDAGSVDILETNLGDDALFLHAIDKSGWPLDAAEDYWRALFDIEGRFVTVSLVTLAENPVSRRAGLTALRSQVAHLINANNG